MSEGVVSEERMLDEDHILAKVYGEDFTKLPKDLYIPPDALEIFLEAFEGPLDLLLYLIKRQNLDVLDIPITRITQQYMDYIAMMQGMRWELAAEYLVMAATLAEIKSRMLLPREKNEEGEEEDPRADLVRRLQEYEQFKKAAENIDAIPRMGRDMTHARAAQPEIDVEKPQPVVELQEILKALGDVLRRADMTASHQVKREPLSVRERMVQILEVVQSQDFVKFTALFKPEEGRPGVVVSFIAILELLKSGVIDIAQSGPFAPIHVRCAMTMDSGILEEAFTTEYDEPRAL